MLPRVVWASCLPVLLVVSPLAAQTDTSALRNAITVSGVRSHLQVLQNSANANGGTRASGTPGHEASALYVQEKLRNAGYDVVVQHFQFTFFEEVSPAQVSQVEPGIEPYAHGTDFLTMRLSGSGSMQGVVVPTNDIIIPASEEPSSTSGCELADFPPAPDEPAVALVQRGGCPYQAKVVNAAAAGYDVIMIFNEGQEGRRNVQPGTLDTPVGIPVLTASFELGQSLYALAQEAMVRVRIETDTKAENRNSTNVIAESADGDSGRVVVVGAHLDSVLEGPGINDNGTGVAAILEVALQLKQLGIVSENRVRFAFWGAEEWGLIGSQYYIDQLSASELGDIMLNLNFDMLGSPNPVRFVLDGDGSHVGPAGPPGSAEIEEVFLDYFRVQSLSTRDSADQFRMVGFGHQWKLVWAAISSWS
jgi:Zn-dependent M28 family amino/carboxypeptidase